MEFKGLGKRWSLKEQVKDGVQRNRLEMEFKGTGQRWSLEEQAGDGSVIYPSIKKMSTFDSKINI